MSKDSTIVCLRNKPGVVPVQRLNVLWKTLGWALCREFIMRSRQAHSPSAEAKNERITFLDNLRHFHAFRIAFIPVYP